MKKIFITILATSFLLFLLLMLISALLQNKKPATESRTPTPTTVPIGRPVIQSEKSINPLQEVVVGITTDEEVQKIPGIKLVSTQGSAKKYTLPSIINSRPQEINTSNGVAIDERIVLPELNTQTGFMTITAITEKYGNPERILSGSSFYGDFTSRYLYPSKGLFFVVNTNTNEVFEIRHFAPMSITDFAKNYPEEATAVSKAEDRP